VSNPTLPRVVLADDHAVVRAGLKMLVESSRKFQVVAEVSDGVQLLEYLAQDPCELVILDLAMPRMDGLQALVQISGKFPKTRVIVLTTYNSRSYLKKALGNGAYGYVVKEDAHDRLIEALEAVKNGKRYISKDLMDLLIDEVAPAGKGALGPEILSAREKEILHLTANGLTSKEIGERLEISYRTVEVHRANIREKLGLENNSELIKYAVDRGLD